MSARAAIVIAVGVGVVVAATVPRAIAPKDRAAGRPFAYSPPAGYVESADPAQTVDAQIASGMKVWTRRSVGALMNGFTPNVSVVHTAKGVPPDEAAVASLAGGMPAVFASTGVTWKEIRHGLHVRTGDGARVAFVEGAAQSKSGQPYRVLQLAFPDDSGASIVTASFAADSDEEGSFMETMDSADGVAFRAPDVPDRDYVAWGAGAAIVAFSVAFAFGRSRPRVSAAAS